MMKGDVFFGAYNKAIAEEIKARVQQNQNAKIDVSTFHAAGYRFWRRVAKDVKIDGNKVRNIFRAAVERNPSYAAFESSVLALVSLGKQAGLGALTPANEEAWMGLVDHHDIEAPESEGRPGVEMLVRLAHKTLQASTALDHEVIDFDDMIYAPLLHNARVWQHDWVLVDEAQATNATRRALALRMLKRGGRLVAVGDSRQAIYGFTGADSEAMELIAKATNAVRMPLTVTYRCPKAVVAYAQQWVRHITAHESAPDGTVERGALKDLAKLAKPGDAVLCRLTAPLITNVYAFIAAGIPARVEGREIGEGLKALASRWKVKSLTQLSGYLDTYLEAETAKLRAKDKEAKAVALEDKVACLNVIIARVRAANPNATVDTLRAEIDGLFGPADAAKPAVTFSTIHKSKGREWNRVVWLVTGASPWARKPWQKVQEDNLCYVATTRAKRELVLVP
jgi:superfamily I DNA/RNA helicase